MKTISNIVGTILLILILLNAGPSLIRSIKEQYQDMLQAKTKVGRIKIDTVIDDISFHQQQLEKFFKNNAIKAILIELDSPGGAAGSSQALFNEILHLKTEYKKTVVTLTYNLCASGAYYIACATDYIIASPSAIIGSIGTYMEQFKLDKLIERFTIGYEIEKTGTYKSSFNFFTPISPEQKKMLQETSDSCYQQFVHDVACRRGLSVTNANQWANGKIFTGNDALKLHLIDEIGSEYNAKLKIKQLALIERDIEWVKPSYPSFWAQLSGQENSTHANSAIIQLCSTIKTIVTALTAQPQLKA